MIDYGKEFSFEELKAEVRVLRGQPRVLLCALVTVIESLLDRVEKLTEHAAATGACLDALLNDNRDQPEVK